MSLVLLALVPTLVVLFYYHLHDRHPEPFRLLALVFVLGALSCLIAYPLERWAQARIPPATSPGYHLFFECLLIAGAIEELVKLLVVLIAVRWRREFDEPIDGLIYGITAALGFTFGEDLRYHLVHGADWARVLSTVAHPWFSSFWAASLGWSLLLPRKQGIALVLLGLTASIVVHALFDFLTLGADLGPAWTWLRHLLVPLLVILYWLVERMLEALQRNTVSETPEITSGQTHVAVTMCPSSERGV